MSRQLRAAESNLLTIQTEQGPVSVAASRLVDRVDLTLPDGNRYEMSRRLGTAIARAFMCVIPDSIATMKALPPAELVPHPRGDA